MLFGIPSTKNAVLHIVDASSFMIGVSMCSFAVIVPAYVRYFTDNPFVFILVPIFSDVFVSLPQTLSVYWMRRNQSLHGSRNIIRDYLWPAIITRAAFIGIGFSVLYLSGNKFSALLSFFFFFALFNIFLGITSPNWINLLSITIPDRIRPIFMGKREFIARVTGIIASFVVPFILALNTFPLNYGYLFLVSGIIMTAGILPARFYESAYPLKDKQLEAPSENFLSFLKSGLKLIWNNHELRTLLVIFWGLSVSRISSAFYTPYIIDRIISRYPANQESWLISLINLCFLVFMAFNAIFGGRLIHKLGHRKPLIIAAASLMFANLIIILFPNLLTAVIGIFFFALAMITGYLAALNAIMDKTDPNLRSTASAFNSTINGACIMIFSVIGSGIAKASGYIGALAFTALLSGIILVLIFRSRIHKAVFRMVK